MEQQEIDVLWDRTVRRDPAQQHHVQLDHMDQFKVSFPALEVMLNSAEHKIFLLLYVEMPTIVGILTLMSRKNSILSLSEPEKS